MKSFFLFLLLIFTGCNFVKESKKISEADKTEKLKNIEDSLKINCKKIWGNWEKKNTQIDSILTSIKKNNILPKSNKLLLSQLTEKTDSVLQIKKSLSAVFEGIHNKPFIMSNISWIKVENGYEEFYAEKEIISKYEKSKSNSVYNKKVSFKNALSDLEKKDRATFVFNKNGKKLIKLESVGFAYNECESYGFYTLNTVSDFSDYLISSPLDLEVEFGNWKHIDEIIRKNNFIMEKCSDCPSSGKYDTTFGKLKGTNNVYFVFSGIKENARKLNQPSRSLVYINNSNEVFTLWSDAIDLFGCSCL